MEYLLLIIPFFIRFLPREFRKDKTDADTWYHISSVNSIYNNGYRIPDVNEGFILGGRYDYPYFSHWLVALFVRGNILKYERYISPIVDIIYIFIAFIYFRFLLDFYQFDEVFQKSINFILLMAFSVSMIKISTGPRVYSFTPRIFGELFTFIYFISFHLYILEGNVLFLFLAMFFGGLTLNTSKFASQVLVLFSLFLTISLFDIIPLLILLLSFLLALLISNGHYKNILFQQLKHMKQYALYGQYNHPALVTRNKFTQYKLFFRQLLKKNFKEAYIIFQKDLIFLNIFYKNLDVVFALLLLLFIDIPDEFLKTILFIGLIIFIITSYKPFQFLGESDRYLDYLLVFSVILIVLFVPQVYINILLIIEVILYLLTLLLYFKLSSDFGENFLVTTAYIKEHTTDKEKNVIHGILGMYINYPLSFLTKLNSLAIEANYVFDLSSNKKLMPKPMLYTNDFDYLYNKYGVNLIVANKKYLNQDMVYNFSKFDLFYENKQYVVYKRKEL
jgi:hypothetical protein